ncbi:hypothetical protein D9Q98_000140 [Chlorella vulgaris]|uniref:Geranylgeranyl transferase type-2 subunit alpha n=1 Tax=Chlorella vulgaris TaxID=3077 RepID=A0A9D4TXN6_CHLVU|nr:hypothetical protein D9Q98_000140 [Chlorella vulgaris]
MHGRPRLKASAPPDPERVKAAEKKAALFGQLAGEVLARSAAKRYDPESLALSAKLLELHPEMYTGWNYRRTALVPVLEAGGEAAVAAVAGELALTQRALLKNHKSYSTWHHRRWVVAKGFCSLEHELQLVNMLLDGDSRNFHGWGYRRFVVQLMGTPAERELEYAALKINHNFSNYSAWHSRTVLLPVLHGTPDSSAAQAAAELTATLRAAALSADPADVTGKDQPQASEQQKQHAGQQQPQQGAAGPTPALTAAAAASAGPHVSAAATAAVPKEALDEEYELVKQAFYTEPEDQSGWFYHRWLLGCSLAHWEQARGSEAEKREREALLAVLNREQQTCKEVLDMEPEAKWALLTLTRLREVQQQVLCESDTATAAEEASGLAAQVVEGYARLKELDPLRSGYYKDAEEGRAQVVARPMAASA